MAFCIFSKSQQVKSTQTSIGYGYQQLRDDSSNGVLLHENEMNEKGFGVNLRLIIVSGRIFSKKVSL
jgi:hypothetical protein